MTPTLDWLTQKGPRKRGQDAILYCAGSIYLSLESSVHLFHPAGIFLSPLQWWHLTIIGSTLRLFFSLINAKSQFDHAVDPLGVHCRFLKSEARRKEGSLKEEHHQVLHRLVALVNLHPLSQVLNYAVVWVDLKVFLGSHVAHGGSVPQRLRLHDSLHVGSPAIL